MRLFWKLFCSMVMIAALACSAGGFALIDGQFRAGLESQADVVMTENTLLRRTLLRELQFLGRLDRDTAVQLAEEETASTEQRGMFYRLTDGQGQSLAGSRLPVESRATPYLADDQQGWEILQNGERYYLHAFSPLVLDSEVLYLENWHEISDLFSDREAQYDAFFYLLLCLILASALAALSVSAWIARPLDRLSAAAAIPSTPSL